MDPEKIAQYLNQSPSNTVIIADGTPITWGQLCAQAATIATHLDPTIPYRLYTTTVIQLIIGLLAASHRNIPVILPQNDAPNTIAALPPHQTHLVPPVSDAVAPSLTWHDMPIWLMTSGSTGTPKLVKKNLSHLLIECDALTTYFGSAIANTHIAGTVVTQHIYGLLCRVLWPLVAKCPIVDPIIFTPEQFIAITNQGPTTVISSPAFLKRLIKLSLPQRPYPLTLVSSGGRLDKTVATHLHKAWGCWPIELLGSTQTGGIATRSGTELWTPFDHVTVSIDEANALYADSSTIAEPTPISTGDLAEWIDTRFRLLSRADRIVKIEEKRLSLDELEQYLIAHDWIEECTTLAIETHRQLIAVVAVLSPTGHTSLGSTSKRMIAHTLGEYLKTRFDAVLCPKRWRFVDQIPINSQGKLIKGEIEKLVL